MEESREDWVEVLRSTDAAYVDLIGSVLDAAGIPYFVQGHEFQHLFPMGGSAPRVLERGLAARVRVPADRADEARELISKGAQVVDEEE